jgi:DNA-binding NarL/FixJ family response regulator
MSFRIWLADECGLLRDSLQNHTLSHEEGFEWAVVFYSGQEMLDHLNGSGFMLPNVICFAYDLPDISVEQFVEQIHARAPKTPLVVYNAPADEETAAALLASGVLGYVSM